MPNTRKYLKHYRTNGTTAPQATDMEHGELAMGYNRYHEKLYIKNTTNTITEFSSDEQLKEIRDIQDERVASAAGLVANTEQDTGEVTYHYSPGSELLSEFTTMNDSVDYLAGQLQECLAKIEEFKANIYVIDTNFEVEPNTGVTQYNVSYQCSYNGNPTTPTSCTITKYVNDGSGTVILSNTGTASASTTSNITGNKEQYVLEVVPDLTGALNTRAELTRYLCYVGASSATTMTSGITETFDKYVSDGISFTADTNTTTGDYLWFIVPDYISIQYVTSYGITVTLDQTVQTITNSLGTFKCYRSYKSLDVAGWPVVIHNIMN